MGILKREKKKKIKTDEKAKSSSTAEKKKEGGTRSESGAVLTSKTPFAVREAYKALRTNVVFLLKNAGNNKAVNIVSSNPSEGKTTTSINLAITFAELNSRVLLVDCDLRKPKIHVYAKIENKEGLSNLLCGFSDIDSVIRHTQYGFDCITSGHIPPNPSELLGSDEMKELVVKLRQKYDYVFFDCPPVNIVADSLSVASCCDGTIFVVNPNATLRSAVGAAIAKYKFADLNIIGIIMNEAETIQRGYYRKSYYKKGYYKKSYYNYYNNSYKEYVSHNVENTKGKSKKESEK